MKPKCKDQNDIFAPRKLTRNAFKRNANFVETIFKTKCWIIEKEKKKILNATTVWMPIFFFFLESKDKGK